MQQENKEECCRECKFDKTEAGYLNIKENKCFQPKCRCHFPQTPDSKQGVAIAPHYTEIRLALSKHMNEWPNALLAEISDLLTLAHSSGYDKGMKDGIQKALHQVVNHFKPEISDKDLT